MTDSVGWNLGQGDVLGGLSGMALGRSSGGLLGGASCQTSSGAVGSALCAPTAQASREKIWKWGADNLLPITLSNLSRSSTIHRRILNDKADYISGRGFSIDPENLTVAALIDKANGQGQSLRSVVGRVAFDKCLFGNAFLEVVTDERGSFVSLYHQDAIRCRLTTDNEAVVLHHNWAAFQAKQARRLPIFPKFERMEDGTLRSVIHYKDYEPGFGNYGVARYVAAMGAASIAYKTDRWNVSRLDNAFQVSGVMVLDGQVDSQAEAAEIARLAEQKFAGKPGQVMFLVKSGLEGDTTKFIPVNTAHDGDWRGLHEQATADIIVAHSWYRTLSGMNYSTGFSPDRILYEYNIALATVIVPEQNELIEPIRIMIRRILGVESDTLQFVNRPPFETKPKYLKIWEARKADGLEYDQQDKGQQEFLSTL